MTVAFVEFEEEIPGNGEPSAFVQCVTLLGLDRASFHAADEGIRPDGEVPEAITADRRRAGADVTLVPPRPCAQAPATPVSWSCQYGSRSRRLSSLPAADLGSGSDRSSIVFGTL
jgi:hypothetical protein